MAEPQDRHIPLPPPEDQIGLSSTEVIAAALSFVWVVAVIAYVLTSSSGDGVLGLVTGSGYLDLGIFTWGWQDLPFSFKILANGPHLALGGFALAMGLRR